MPWHGRQKRNPLPPSALLSSTVNVRLTREQHDTYLALGGVDWFRRTLDEAKPLEVSQPCAHQPFPIGPDRFTQNQCRITCQADGHPGDKGGPTGY